MSQDEGKNDPIWMFRNEPRDMARAKADYDAFRAIYRLYRNTRNPYLKRTLGPAARKEERSAAEVARLFRLFSEQRQYLLAPSNTAPPFERRVLAHPPPPATTDATYQDPARLPGNENRSPWMIDEFFTSVLARLREDPGTFSTVVEQLMDLFAQHHVTIRLYHAYYALEDWQDLMETLTEVSQYPSLETFDLFCSALFAYYDLVYPAEEP